MIIKDLESLDLGFDVIIIGAGAAGCAVASNLSDNLKVLLVDSKDFPRKKACSGILVTEGQDYFDGLLDNSVLVPPINLDIQYIDWDNNLEKLAKKNFINTDRFALDNYLLDLVRNKKHISFIKNTTFIEFTLAQDGTHKVVMLESNGLVKPVITKHLVGCDGALSSIRKRIFGKEIRFYIGVQELIRTQEKFDKAYFIFDNDITDFYSWIIPKRGLVEIGSLLEPRNSKESFSLLKEKLSNKFSIVGEGPVHSAIVLRPESIKDICLGKDSILLCGEAAGLISPSSAEGISYALRSGKYCAQAINSGKDPLREYTKNCGELLSRLNKKFEKSKILSDKVKRKNMFL
jgi:flavin-dependent dehydrogenase